MHCDESQRVVGGSGIMRANQATWTGNKPADGRTGQPGIGGASRGQGNRMSDAVGTAAAHMLIPNRPMIDK
jgi:hypothetical protein